MMLDLPELFAPKSSVSGFIGTRCDSPKALKLPIPNSVITPAVLLHRDFSSSLKFTESITLKLCLRNCCGKAGCLWTVCKAFASWPGPAEPGLKSRGWKTEDGKDPE